MSSIEKAINRQGKVSLDSSNSQENQQEPCIEARSSETEANDASEFVHRLDLEAFAKGGFLVPSEERSSIAEEYRQIKRPLLMNAFGKGAVPIERGNMVMITSSLPGEGKTFTSFNLAMSMAMEMDKTVLLIDSDVVKPSLTSLLGLTGKRGLIDILLDTKVDLQDIIITTDIPRLKVIPAGRSHHHSTELLASEQMNILAKELSERYPDRMVVFDAPPLLVASETSVIAHQVGQVLMVVEAANTPQTTVKEALSKLDQDDVIGMILNKSRQKSQRDYYGGYY